MLHVINLINGKLRTEGKFNQVLKNILNHTRYADHNVKFTMDSSKNLYNHWLAGFSDADASFQIKILKRINRDKPEIRLKFKIDKKSNLLLVLIKEYLGGNIGYRISQDTYYYGSTSFGSAIKVIKYFDQYHLQSRKHISYLRWRKAYRLIQNKEHLTEKGLTKILIIKSLINHHD
uniref:LAGLIDADG n=2 Tax=Rhynchosporium TaxID=38037 RepID=V5W6E3_RHYSE|nr:LAGLIDADG [Rhynchosporium commune]YP_008965420.1 LAGLIDADG [Rhynchosporium secalis]AHC02367.1 LAGLIDADG [Rhynchosporium commune]AHC02440.1 LAGLIDADG [Rhynchosporium secalis]